MASISIAQINEAVESKFGNFTIDVPAADGEGTEEIAFMYYLRAPKAAREKLATAFGKLQSTEPLAEGEDGVDALVAIFQDAFKALAVKADHYKKLVKVLGDDLVSWTYLLNQYGEKYAGSTPEA